MLLTNMIFAAREIGCCSNRRSLLVKHLGDIELEIDKVTIKKYKNCKFQLK